MGVLYFKLRLGPWRIIYDVNEAEKLVRVNMEHRERVYAGAKRRLDRVARPLRLKGLDELELG
ncbi:MAG TPA: hypothetical protein EYP17_08795 [Candidatus Latescibacteria bacterium]|nr:hypothetical protein [Candidatus Latescibacterota bacterium]